MKLKLSNILHWLILTSFFILFSACSNMSSVRNGKYIIAKSEKLEQIKNVNSDTLETINKNNNTEVLISNDEIPAPKTDGTQIRHIPTLQQQLNSLASRQDTFDERLGKIETQTQNIDNKLAQITELLKEKKNEVKPATTGLISDNTNPKPKKESFVLYPDDVSTHKRKVLPKKKTITGNNPSSNKEVEPQYYKKEANYVESKDYNSALLSLLKEEQKQTNPDKLAECRFLIAKSFLAINRYKQAEDYCKKVLQSAISYEKKAEMQVSLAKIQMKLGNKEAAKKAYETIIDKYATTLYVIEAKKMLQQL